MFKKCSCCKEYKETTEFHKNNSAKDGYYAYCKFCNNIKTKKYQKRTYQQRKDIIKKTYERYIQKYKEKDPNYFKNKTSVYRFNFRKKVIVGYGGKCTCCGESQYEFLAIDHVNNDGNEDRKKMKNSYRIHRYIIDNNFPKEYQILCHNCNLSKAFHGYCPHKIN